MQMVDPEIFCPGVPAVMEVSEAGKKKYTTYFRGYKSKQYLILDHPTSSGKSIHIPDGTAVIIRFIHEGSIIGFRTTAICNAKAPSPLIFLRFPQAVESSRLRKSERYPVSIECICSGKRLSGAVDSHPRATVLNLSEGGCMVEAIGDYDKGTLVFLTVFLPEQGRVDDVEAEVKRVDKKGDRLLLGLAFADLLDPGFEEIRGYLNMLKTYRVRA
jgi:c-di-GMP-binding flagellar brake protein YcgR